VSFCSNVALQSDLEYFGLDQFPFAPPSVSKIHFNARRVRIHGVFFECVIVGERSVMMQDPPQNPGSDFFSKFGSMMILAKNEGKRRCPSLKLALRRDKLTDKKLLNLVVHSPFSFVF
jgi:hypothetical protein